MGQTAVSRALLPLPILLLPPVITRALTSVLPPLSAAGNRALGITVIAGCLLGALPATMGVFPERYTLPVARLEPQFQNLKREDGTPIVRATYYRGT